MGNSQIFNEPMLILQSMAQGKSMILVNVNYRFGAFRFLEKKNMQC